MNDPIAAPHGDPSSCGSSPSSSRTRVSSAACGSRKIRWAIRADSSSVKSVLVLIDVIGYHGLSATVSTTAPTWDGRYLNYTLEVRNKGNGAENFRLTLPNVEELLAAGWRATLVLGGGTPQAELRIPFAANQTLNPVLRLERVGVGSAILARVHVVNEAHASDQALITASVRMPVLAVEGSIRAGGTGITLQEPGIDLATAAFLVSLVAVIAAAVYLSVLRRRSR